MSKQRLRVTLLVLTVATYGVSLLLPSATISCCTEATVPGFAVVVMIPVMIPVALLQAPRGDFLQTLAALGMLLAWAANPLYWLGLQALAARRSLRAAAFGLSAVLVGLIALTWWFGLSAGYFVWLASMALLSVGSLCLHFYPDAPTIDGGRLPDFSEKAWRSPARLPVLPSGDGPSTDVKTADNSFGS